jgi:hypothetical protein
MENAGRRYSRGEHVVYDHLMRGGSSTATAEVVAAYASAHPQRSMSEELTFEQWWSEAAASAR